MSKIEDAPEGMLRAWADAGVISSASYVEELERRRTTGRLVVDQVPPLGYVLDRELDIPGLELTDFAIDDDDGVPNPAPGAWLVAFFLATVIIAAVLIWRSWP